MNLIMLEKDWKICLGAPEQAELIWQPENYIEVNEEKRATSLMKLMILLIIVTMCKCSW